MSLLTKNKTILKSIHLRLSDIMSKECSYSYKREFIRMRAELFEEKAKTARYNNIINHSVQIFKSLNNQVEDLKELVRHNRDDHRLEIQSLQTHNLELSDEVRELRQQLSLYLEILEGKGSPSIKIGKLKKELGLPTKPPKQEE